MTVTSEVKRDALGITLPHEQVLVAFIWMVDGNVPVAITTLPVLWFA